jgi:hypothetical protein
VIALSNESQELSESIFNLQALTIPEQIGALAWVGWGMRDELRMLKKVDDITAIADLLERLDLAKREFKQKTNELDSLSRMHDRELRVLQRSRKQREFFRHQEPLVFVKVPKGAPQSAAELLQVKPSEPEPEKGRFSS